jgi:hypothetical protein
MTSSASRSSVVVSRSALQSAMAVPRCTRSRSGERSYGQAMRLRIPGTVSLLGLALTCTGIVSAQPQGRNLISNPGFENGITAWVTGNGWYEMPKGGGTSVAVVDDQIAHSGKCSLRLDGGGKRGLVMHVLRVRPGKYHFSAWIRTKGLGAAEAFILAEWMSKEDKWLAGNPLKAVSGDADWTLCEGDVEAPAAARSVHLDLITNVPNTGAAWFDDVAFTRVPVATQPPAAVKFSVTASPGGSGMLLVDWAAHMPEPDVLDYKVYCADKPFNSVKLLQPAVAVDADARSVKLGGLRNAKAYYCAVVAVNLEGLAAEAVTALPGTPKDLRPPHVPALTATPLTTGARFAPAAMLSWTTDPTDDDIAGFTLTVGDAARDAAVPRRLPASQRSLVLKNLPQADATVTLAAFDASGNVSPPATAQLHCPAATTVGSDISGTVTAAGQPVAGASVAIRRGKTARQPVVTDAAGAFRANDLPEAVYSLQASRDGMPASVPVHILTGGGPVTAQIEMTARTPWAAWAATPVDNVLREAEPPAAPAQAIRLLSMTNQTRTAQVAIRPTEDLRLNGVRFEDLVTADGQHSVAAENCRYNFVSYCHLDKNSTDTPAALQVRKAPGDFPDELSDDLTRDVKANETQPIILAIHTPRGTAPGTYRGRAFVQTPLGEQPFNLTLRVVPVQFPDNTRLFVVNWFDSNAIATQYGLTVGSDEYWKMLRVFAKMMKAHHQNVVVVPPDLCRIWIEADKSATFDWTEFDRFAQLFVDEGVGDRLCIGHLGGRTTGEWECKTFGLWPRAATVRATGEATTVTPEAFATALQGHLEKKQWLARALQHIGDEPLPVNAESYKEQSARIHKAAPKLRRIDAIQTPDLKGALEVWVPQINYFDQWYEGYRKFQQSGDAELWFYLAWVPQGKYAQRLVDRQAIEPRVIHWMNYLWGTSGYLHWALEWWNINVESLAPGDSRIIWPGKTGPNSSLRYEAQREGLEDCEMLSLLEDAYRDAAAKLGVRDFDVKARPKELGHSVVRTFTDYTRSYDELEAVRAQVLDELASLRQGPALLTRVSETADKPLKPGIVTVEGWTEAGAAVTVNGKAATVSEGRFQAQVAVSADARAIIVAAAKDGKTMRVRRAYRVEQR